MVLFFFVYFSLVSIVAGVLTIAFRNPVHCGLALLTLLLHVALKTDQRYLHTRHAIVLFATAGICGELLLLLLQSPFNGAKGDAPVIAVLKDGDSFAVGIKMFSDYLLPFEIVGVFLLGAIIGAIVLAKTPSSVDAEQENP
ncbi:MAG: NADH-quinone oxidoreductase subunit J [Nitrospirae bacterium]|nr:NADH-quinone oxidoreductase subunit J [Nitrospirota bacterium]